MRYKLFIFQSGHYNHFLLLSVILSCTPPAVNRTDPAYNCAILLVHIACITTVSTYHKGSSRNRNFIIPILFWHIHKHVQFQNPSWSGGAALRPPCSDQKIQRIFKCYKWKLFQRHYSIILVENSLHSGVHIACIADSRYYA